MSKIPMPGPFGTTFIETDPEPMTPEQELEYDRINAKLDRDLTLIYQNKLTALGYANSYRDAQNIYKGDFEIKNRIDQEYFQLQSQQKMNEAIGSLEKILRELGN